MSPYEAREYLSRDPRSLECEALRALDDARAEIDAAERALWDALFPRAAASAGGGQ